MQSLVRKLLPTMRLFNEENGQDLIEYALVVSLIAFAAIAGMNSVASNVNTAFTNIATVLASSA